MRRIYLSAIMMMAVLVQGQTLIANKIYDKGDTSEEVANKGTGHAEWSFIYANNLQFTPEELAENDYALGSENGCLMKMLKSKCIRKEEIVPGDPQTRTVIQKPAIYSAVITLEKHFKKELKTDKMQKQVAEASFHKVIVAALAAIDAHETGSFEDALQDNRKDAGKLLAIFDQVTLTNLY